MKPATQSYLKSQFSDYYETVSISDVPNEAMREFGYIPWNIDGRTIMKRHKSITTYGTVADLLRTESPRHAYYSTAEYLTPDAPSTAQKNEQSVDLIFDIDGDHFAGHDSMTYPEMLERSKQEVFKLLDYLTDDFGFSKENIYLFFSGGRGYHIHVRDSIARQMSTETRTQIIDYLTGKFDIAHMGVTDYETEPTTSGFEVREKTDVIPVSGGWGERINSQLDSLTFDPDVLQEIDGIGSAGAEWICENEDVVRNGDIDTQHARTLYKHLREKAHEEYIVDVDEPVTTDIHRLIRIPKSVHGGTGMCVRPIPHDELASFSPTVDAVLPTAPDECSVVVTQPGIYTFGNETYELEQRPYTLPGGIAIYLMASGKAEYDVDAE